MNPDIEESEEQQELKFDSQFESGNLDMVIKKTLGQDGPAHVQTSNDRLYYNRI